MYDVKHYYLYIIYTRQTVFGQITPPRPSTGDTCRRLATPFTRRAVSKPADTAGVGPRHMVPADRRKCRNKTSSRNRPSPLTAAPIPRPFPHKDRHPWIKAEAPVEPERLLVSLGDPNADLAAPRLGEPRERLLHQRPANAAGAVLIFDEYRVDLAGAPGRYCCHEVADDHAGIFRRRVRTGGRRAGRGTFRSAARRYWS